MGNKRLIYRLWWLMDGEDLKSFLRKNHVEKIVDGKLEELDIKDYILHQKLNYKWNNGANVQEIWNSSISMNFYMPMLQEEHLGQILFKEVRKKCVGTKSRGAKADRIKRSNEDSAVMRFKRSDAVLALMVKVHENWGLTHPVQDYEVSKASSGHHLKYSKSLHDYRLNDNDELKFQLKKKDNEEKKPKEKESKEERKEKKKHKGEAKPQFFGVPLEEVVVSEELGYPEFFETCIVYLEKEAMQCEGLFRISGQANVIQSYREKINKGEKLDISEERLQHNVSGLLKLFFREMPNPVINYDYYEMFLASQYLENADRLKWLKYCLTKMSPVAYLLLRRLTHFLLEFSKQSSITKMGVENIALVIGPNLLRQQNESMMDMVKDTEAVNLISRTLIFHCEELFPWDRVQEVSDRHFVSLCLVLHDYQAASSAELTIKPKDTIWCTVDSADDGWWEGENINGEHGLFPEDYVQQLWVDTSTPEATFEEEYIASTKSNDSATVDAEVADKGYEDDKAIETLDSENKYEENYPSETFDESQSYNEAAEAAGATYDENYTHQEAETYSTSEDGYTEETPAYDLEGYEQETYAQEGLDIQQTENYNKEELEAVRKQLNERDAEVVVLQNKIKELESKLEAQEEITAAKDKEIEMITKERDDLQDDKRILYEENESLQEKLLDMGPDSD